MIVDRPVDSVNDHVVDRIADSVADRVVDRVADRVADRIVAIVPVRDGEALLPRCLEALLESDGGLSEIVVIDDGSRDASVAVARDWASRSNGRIRVLVLARNHGFAGAVNRAVESAIAATPATLGAATVLVLVNQDCVVMPGWLGPLVAALDDPAVAVAGARLLDADGVTLQHAGARIETNALTTHLGRGCTDARAWRETLDVDYVCGALMAMRVANWRLFGPFDEGYAPAYYEEVDLCVRVRRAGLRVVYVPTSEARHVEASSSRDDETSAAVEAADRGQVSGRGSRIFLRRYHRSRLRFVVRVHARDVGALRWLIAEARWLFARRHRDEIAPVLAAYACMPRFVVEKLREALR